MGIVLYSMLLPLPESVIAQEGGVVSECRQELADVSVPDEEMDKRNAAENVITSSNPNGQSHKTLANPVAKPRLRMRARVNWAASFFAKDSR